jgi:uncharacterized membrane protein YidH (DUF202 family)
MRPLGIVGIVLIIVGIICFAYGGMSWSNEKKDAQLGPVEISHKEQHGFAVPPVLSGLLVVGGIVLLVAGARRT